MIRALTVLSLFMAVPAYGQSYYLHGVTRQPNAWPSQDAKFSIAIAVGQWNGNVFIPDLKSHTYSYLRTDPWYGGDTTVFTLLSPHNGSFTGFDTLTFNYHASTSSDVYGVFEFDEQHIDSAFFSGDDIASFTRLSVGPLDTTFKIGANVLVPINISSSNYLPVTIQSITFSGDSDIHFIDSSVHTPWSIFDTTAYPPLYSFVLRITPTTNAPYTTRCQITVVTAWGDNWLDTEVYNYTFHFDAPEPGECLQAPYDIEFDGVMPFGYSSTQTIPVYNPQPVSITISSVTLDTFEVHYWKPYLMFDSTQFPIVVRPHDSGFVLATLTVPADSFDKLHGFTSVYFNLNSNDSDGVSCPYSDLEVYVQTLRFWRRDTISIPLFSPDITAITFPNGEAGGAPQGMFVRFVNNSANPVRPISHVISPDSTDYAALLWQYSSDTALQPNEGFVTCLAWLQSDRDFGNYLSIQMEDGDTSRDIPIDHPFESVTPLSADKRLTRLHPNPASNYTILELEGHPSVSLHILDVLGREVFKNDVSNSSDVLIQTSNLLPGIYFVTVQGIDERGNSFISSQPLSIR